MWYRRDEIDAEARNLLASEMMSYVKGETSHSLFVDLIEYVDTKCYKKNMHDKLVYKTWYYLVYLVYCCDEYSVDGKFEGDDRLDDKLIELFKQLEACIKTDMLNIPQDLEKKINIYIGLDAYRREKRLDKICGYGLLVCFIAHVIIWVVFYFVEK